MARQTGFRLSVAIVLGLLVVSPFQPVRGQGIGSTLEPQARVFPSIGPGVTALKSDSAGRYYILAMPANVVWIYDRTGTLIGKFPNANSHGAAIKYAVDIDLGKNGRLFVADRGANAIEIFDPDGSLVARVPVVAPTSVVALSGNQFAVTSLASTHLVQIIDERGKVVRSFGDPAYIADDTDKNRVIDWGRITGDSADSIYFAFASLAEPTLRKYDRFGYVGYETDIPESFFSAGTAGTRDRVEFGLNFTDLALSERTSSWISVGSSGDVKFGGGVGMGLNQIFASGGGLGRSTRPGATGFGNASYNLGNNSLAGMFSGELSSQGTQFHLGVGSMSGLGGGGRRARGGSSATFSDQLDDQGGVLQFFGSGTSLATATTQDDSGGDLYFNAQDLDADTIPGSDTSGILDASGNVVPPEIGLNPTFGAPGAFNAWSIFNSRDFRPRGGLGRPNGLAGASGPNSSGGLIGPSAGGPGLARQRFAGSGSDGIASRGSFGPHWRFGAGATSITATARVNLGHLGGDSADKPQITAVSVDPATQEMWVGIGDALVGLSKDGTPIGVYYLTINGDVPLQPSAVLVESDRFLVAADPWGIFEFDRPGGPRAINHAVSTRPQLTIEPQVISPRQ